MKLTLPQDLHRLHEIKCGDVVELTGTIYTARDAAHMRLQQILQEDAELPVDFKNSFIYYAGPTPTKPGHIIGSIGPTTSSRMDAFASMMTKLEVLGTIGKGPRSQECTDYYIQNKLLYFVTTGGCGALLAKAVKEAEEIAFLDLGPESIKRLSVQNFTMVCAIDWHGHSLFKEITK